MNAQRFVVTDRLWRRFEALLPGKGVTAGDNRLFPEAVFWRVRTGSPWRDLPSAFGNWNSRFRRFRRWAERGVFESLFNAMSGDPDLEYALIDGTLVPVHQQAAGAKGGLKITPSDARGGLTTALQHMLVCARVDQNRGAGRCAG